MKKFLFCPLCLIMGSCLPDGDTSSNKTLQLNKICEELDKYFDTLNKDQTSQSKEVSLLRKISSVLLAVKKIYDVEKDNTNVVVITKTDIEYFKNDKQRKETQPKKDDKAEENSNIYLSDLVNYYFKKKGFALLKNRKYLV